MNVTHIVGLQGTGKSTLAALMVADLEKRGARCAVVDSEAMAIDFKCQASLAAAANSGVDHLFLEWLPSDFFGTPQGGRLIQIIDLPNLAEHPDTHGVDLQAQIQEI